MLWVNHVLISILLLNKVQGEDTKEFIFETQSGYILSVPSDRNVKHGTEFVANDLECALRCTKEKWCNSANFGLVSEKQSNGLHLCELFSTDEEANLKYLERNEKFVHLSIKILNPPCQKLPCLNEGTCIKVYDRGGFECRCINGFSGSICQKACTEQALGMESRTIPDSSITASSAWGGKDTGYKARLNNNPGHWAPSSNRVGEWLQVDFGRLTLVTKVATQGRPFLQASYMTSYSLSYRREDESWKSYVHTSLGGTLPGNTNYYGTVTNTLDPKITTRYILIYPKTWYHAITIRVEFYGCYLS
ncbi:venom prothrombin activator oscutarin-C non-catalytic subunit-like [Actinia tenebrosa]|uniref:Venom prothrombin activator oscutarin-C non-catalytic subunit-like n=1 Tax=Actinia tenebrosa TaxID=6105 RepID=A0A6P8IXS1_ACTTE|nr:venom prothrombin activator oscutarin-C non-catalytic subunit-like [Actinia tenebrosa]